MNKVLFTHLLGQRAGLLRRVEDFVVEDGEVEGQAQSDGVCWLHVLLADVEGFLVGLLRVLHRVCTMQITSDLTAPLNILHQQTLYRDHLPKRTVFTVTVTTNNLLVFVNKRD